MPKFKDDKYWMLLAIEQAFKGRSTCAPNPAVGAVIVKQGHLLGTGWHKEAGQPHAEREAIADTIVKHGIDSLKGATIYITLEPCSTEGRTPPCTSGIIEVGITRVVYGAIDPNPNHNGSAEMNRYAQLNLSGQSRTQGRVGEFQKWIGKEKDFLPSELADRKGTRRNPSHKAEARRPTSL